MVKITNLHEEDKPQEEEIIDNIHSEEEEKAVTPEEYKEIERKYSRPLNPYDISCDTAKTHKLNTRITENIGNTLKVYTELNNISISQFIEELITEKFEGKKVNRDYYPIEETLIAVPNTLDLIKEYTSNKKNLVVAYSEITKGYPISPFDKQYGLASLKNPPIEFLFIGGANNYLDQVDLVNHVYYSKRGYDLTEYDVFKELEEGITHTDMLKNHLGLIIYPLDYMKEYNSETHEYEEIDMLSGTQFFLYFLVYQYDNKITKVQLVDKKTAIALALEVENPELLEYINNCTDITEFKEITETQELLLNQSEHIHELEEKLKDLEEENTQLRKYAKSFLKEEEEEDIPEEVVPEETIPPQEEEEPSEVIIDIPEETLKTIMKAQKELQEAMKLVNKHTKTINKVMGKNRNVLDKMPKIPK